MEELNLTTEQKLQGALLCLHGAWRCLKEDASFVLNSAVRQRLDGCFQEIEQAESQGDLLRIVLLLFQLTDFTSQEGLLPFFKKQIAVVEDLADSLFTFSMGKSGQE